MGPGSEVLFQALASPESPDETLQQVELQFISAEAQLGPQHDMFKVLCAATRLDGKAIKTAKSIGAKMARERDIPRTS